MPTPGNRSERESSITSSSSDPFGSSTSPSSVDSPPPIIKSTRPTKLETSTNRTAPETGGRQFKQEIRFVFAGDKESGKKVQEHIQREYARKKKWKREVKQVKDAKQARDSFNQFVVRSKGIPRETGDGDRKEKRARERRGAGRKDEPVTKRLGEGEHGVLGDGRPPEEAEDVEEIARVESCPGPVSFLGAGRANPFGSSTWPVGVKGLDGFIDSFIGLDYRVFGLSSASQWRPVGRLAFGLAMQDPAPMQAIAAYGAAWVAPAHSREVLGAKSQALRMVNERLLTVSDPLIYAVSILWMFEWPPNGFEKAKYGTPEARSWHAKAVQRMVQVRGGYHVLDFRLRLQLAWMVISFPDALNLGILPDDMYLQAQFTEFIGFTECVHILASSRWSPYSSEAQYFAEQAHLYNLLSGLVESRGVFKAAPKMYGVCRMTVLLYIHAIFLEYHHSPVTLGTELAKLRLNLKIMQPLERRITLEGLTLMIFKDGLRDDLENSERTLMVLRMITIVKMFSAASINNLLVLFFGYLTGKTFDNDVRGLFWNVDEMEEEAFGGT